MACARAFRAGRAVSLFVRTHPARWSLDASGETGAARRRRQWKAIASQVGGLLKLKVASDTHTVAFSSSSLKLPSVLLAAQSPPSFIDISVYFIHCE